MWTLARRSNADAALWPYEVSFDGGIGRGTAGESAGAGATLWVRDPFLGMRCVARAVRAIPGEARAPMAETRAGALALDLLSALRAGIEGRWALQHTRRARAVGDGLRAVRYGAAQARLRDPQVLEHFDLALGRVCRAGWHLDWQAVRRRHNQAAHDLADVAKRWAAALHAAGYVQTRTIFEWVGDSPARLEHADSLGLPAWP